MRKSDCSWSARPVALRVALVGAVWVLLAAVALGVAGRWQASGRSATRGDAKVVVFGITHLGFADLGPRTTPVLWRLIHTRAALGATSIRSKDTLPGSLEGYAAMGAGSRLAAPASGGIAGAASAPSGSSTAGAALGSRTGRTPDGEIVVPSGISVLRANIGLHEASRAGALGAALRRAGLRTAVVGNADVPDLVSGRWMQARPAALALMDDTFAVSAGEVDRRLLVSRSPFVVARADPGAMLRATTAALRSADAVMVDPGDMDRAAAFGAQALPGPAATERRAALRRTDALLGAMLRRLPARTLVLVVSVSAPPQGRLTPTVAIGPGITRGTLSSPSTKRNGLVTLTDLAPTILSALHVPTPPGMVGHPIAVTPGAAPDLQRYRDQDAASATSSTLYLPAVIVFIVVQGLVYLWLIVATRTQAEVRRRAVRFAAVSIALWPVSTYAMAVIPGAKRADVPIAGLVLAGMTFALAALCLRLGRSRTHPLAPLAWALGLTVAIPVVDVVIGGPLHTSTLLGFSLPGAGRFYGWPNSTFSIAGSAALVLCAIVVSQFGRRAEVLAACAGGLAFVAMVDGAPPLGADIGGILVLVPIYVLFVVALLGRGLSRRAWTLAGLATVGVLAVAITIDELQPPSARTDLADFVNGLINGGTNGAVTTITRKETVNFDLFGHTVWTWMIPVVAIFIAWALGTAARRRRLIPAGSALRSGVIGAFALAVLGFLLNDSGPQVIALSLVFVGPLLALLLAEGDGDGGHEEAAGSARTRRAGGRSMGPRRSAHGRG